MAAEETTTVVDTLRQEGNELFKIGKYVEAAGKYTEALGLEPKNHLLLSNRSLALSSAKKFDQAIADARECLRIDPEFVKGYYRLANAQLGLGLIEEALATTRRGLEKDENNSELKKLLRQIKQKRDISRKSEKDNEKKDNRNIPSRKGNKNMPSLEKQKELDEIAQTLNAHEREYNNVSARAQLCRRENVRAQLTTSEIAALPDETPLFRSIGKIFLKNDKPAIMALLESQKHSAEQRLNALQARGAFLQREISAKQQELESGFAPFKQQLQGEALASA
uniref:Uncharacterized protein n=1 Tax=Aureoumbra lagunensis TaxID=44058 RepID=A0A7S3JX18_9STRA|eukprot:CAMPEP_0197313474 /NCGR_PEP_ID=MMETSP0891-20130614/28070_1 /TAXON_ID=44058 ORGANISM="Aureoumbra lagunensis, Strain CCMP1510" /NCGR_SAMPLE_ID=MMETSP0891 /ASSEMBLY_ACC=CAM_ASM_000534 /LENGTH=279 /DNA_ID=CAMNT_0042801357 /DNA_START=12 /DNA_END=851 /DNA_ORIENTATION=+